MLSGKIMRFFANAQNDNVIHVLQNRGGLGAAKPEPSPPYLTLTDCHSERNEVKRRITLINIKFNRAIVNF